MYSLYLLKISFKNKNKEDKAPIDERRPLSKKEREQEGIMLDATATVTRYIMSSFFFYLSGNHDVTYEG